MEQFEHVRSIPVIFAGPAFDRLTAKAEEQRDLLSEMLTDEALTLMDSWEAQLDTLWASGTPMNAPKPGSGTGDDDSEDDDTSDDDDDDDSEDSSDDDDDEDDDDKKDPEVVKAYNKLRDAEKREREATAKLRKMERKGMNEAETAKAERDDARAEAADLQLKLDRIEAEKTITSVAKSLKFVNPEKAKRFVAADITGEKEIKAALKEALDDFPSLKADGAPAPPINEKTGNEKDGNARMNASLRRMAGRS